MASNESKDSHKEAIDELLSDLPEILKESEYDELWGHQLTTGGEFYDEEVTLALLTKMLKANGWKLPEAKEQLKKTLKWRKEFKPLHAAFKEKHDAKFDNVVVLTQYGDDIMTWNLYNTAGDAKPKDLFTDVDAFLRFRAGVMERSLQLLDFKEREYTIQIHDYEGVSFLRFDPDIKKGSRATIQLFQDNYPELLKQKFFVNVPWLMSWVYDFVKRWISGDTSSKFVMLPESSLLVGYLGKDIPKRYGGEGALLKEQDVGEVNKTPYTEFILTSRSNDNS